MAKLGKILLADDEDTFLRSTADLLRREGYDCDCVPDSAGATRKLRENEYDLLIADIKMAGNSELELIRDLPNIAKGIPVILVTGYPFLGSAIESVRLRVEAYLVKPFDFRELLRHVRLAVARYRVYRSIHNMKQRLLCWYEGMANVEEVLKDKSQTASAISLDTFLELTCQNIVGAVSDLKHLARILAGQTEKKEACHLFNCPRVQSLADSLTETIDVLQRSKKAFKSKELGEIRRKLEGVVNSKA
jgi:DNA-binding response OmpR family regulator